MPRAVILALLLAAQAHADEAFRDAAKEVKAREIAAARARFDECNERMKAAIKAKDPDGAKQARAEMMAASKELARARSKPLSDYAEQAEQEAAEAARARAEKRKENERKSIELEEVRTRLRKIGPIFIQDAAVVTNVIGLPELNFVVRNSGSQAVEAFDVEAVCLNSFDEPVKGFLTGSVFLGACSTAVPPGEERHLSVQLSLHQGTTQALVRITRVKLASGEVWVQSKQEAEEIPGAIFEAK